jgi:hypothetical protein
MAHPASLRCRDQQVLAHLALADAIGRSTAGRWVPAFPRGLQQLQRLFRFSDRETLRQTVETVLRQALPGEVC